MVVGAILGEGESFGIRREICQWLRRGIVGDWVRE